MHRNRHRHGGLAQLLLHDDMTAALTNWLEIVHGENFANILAGQFTQLWHLNFLRGFARTRLPDSHGWQGWHDRGNDLWLF